MVEKNEEQNAKELIATLFAVNRKERRKRMKELKLTKNQIPTMTKKESEAISEKIRSTVYESAMYWATRMAKKNNKYLFDNADIRRRKEIQK